MKRLAVVTPVLALSLTTAARAAGRLVALTLLVTWAESAGAATLRCAADSVKVGNVCVDKYEASVWSIAPSNTGLVRKVQKGIATLADLTAGGATQLGCTGAPFSLTAYSAN